MSYNTAPHIVAIDEGESTDPKDEGQPIFKAFCDGKDCTWSAETWHHPDEFVGYAYPVDAAMNAASEDGKQHLIDEGYDPL